ncbi:MAG: glutathione peroxidase [Polyangiaceae bacterium]
MSVHDFEAKTIDGKSEKLSTYAGKTLLIVNVASKCGLTPQYEGLEALYRKYQGRGLVVLGFPCDQFAHQEPGTESEIKEFCQSKYDVTFPLFSKVDVNGPSAHPLFQYMRKEQPGPAREGDPEPGSIREKLETMHPELKDADTVKWNFTKFLVGPRGDVIRRFEPKETPAAIDGAVAASLG